MAIFIILAGFVFYPQISLAVDTYTSPTMDAKMDAIVAQPAPSNSTASSTEQQRQSMLAGGLVGGKASNDSCVGPMFLASPLICTLLAILSFITWLLGVASAIFAAMIDVQVIHSVLANPAIYTAWGQIRDILNIAFILFLLYSAFCIIFQVGGKYGEKKIILTIVLMALLVNFSFPITRFIIDASNSLMYTLLQQLLPSVGNKPINFITGITQGSDMQTIITSTKNNASAVQLLAAIVFTFLLTLTFLALAVLFLIRVAALAMLIIASPIAFVGNIAGKDFGWWDYLFKYAFFGPVMVLALAISIAIMNAMSSSANFGDDNVLAAMANMTIPIVVLWMSMSIAQEMGIAGASQVMGKAQSFAKGAATGSWKATGIPGGFKKGWENARKKGTAFGAKIPPLKDTREDREAGIGGFMADGFGGYKKAQKNKKQKEFNEKAKENQENHNATETSELVRNIQNTDVSASNAIDIAGQYRQLVSDPVRKDEQDAAFKLDILQSNNHQTAMNNLARAGDSAETIAAKKEAYIKKKIAEKWGKLRNKANQAQNMYTTGSTGVTPTAGATPAAGAVNPTP